MKSLSFNNVYLQETSIVGGVKESQGPLGEFFDEIIKRKKKPHSYEDEEIIYLKKAIKYVLNKANRKDIDLLLGGELSSQLSISHQTIMHFPASFIGIYGACASIILSMIVGCNFISSNQCHNALVFTSSNYFSSERNFRYPILYGYQRKSTATLTISAAACGIISSAKSKIQIVHATIGSVIDTKMKNYCDLGSPMALACFLTLKNHLTNLKKSVLDYDYVITGDLSSLGSQVFLSLCKSSGYPIKKHLDGGKMVYPDDKKYFQGGSGPSCVALILFSYVKKLFLEDKINRVLVIGTGALFSKMSAEQNKTLPTIAHCIELARSL